MTIADNNEIAIWAKDLDLVKQVVSGETTHDTQIGEIGKEVLFIGGYAFACKAGG